MRLWAEERKTGSIELLLTQPITLWQAVLGKFLAAWIFVGIALVLTFPIWITVNYLGDPDNGAAFAGYIGAFIMAGAFLAVGSCMSALTNNQVIAFVLTALTCFLFALAGFPAITEWSRALFSGIASWGIWGSGMREAIQSFGAALTDGIASLSFLTHFENITKGVLDLRDLLYFALVIVFFLLASTVLLDARKVQMNKPTLGAGSLALVGLLFIGITLLANTLLRGAQLDLTQDRLYTLSDGTRNILRGLKEPVNLYLFFSDRTATPIPDIKNYGTRVRELLESMASRSNGKLTLRVIDPQPFSEEEDRATELGVQGMPINAGGEKLYLGLAATNSTDGKEAIPFLDPKLDEQLEYDVAKLVHKLSSARKPVVGWMSSLPMGGEFDMRTGRPGPTLMVYAQAEQLYAVRTIDPSVTSIDADVDVLVLVHPKDLPPAALYAIDQFAMRGGHVLAFVDPNAQADQSGADPNNPMAQFTADKSSHLEPLLASWGVEFKPDQVVADLERGLVVGMREGEPPSQHIAILGFDNSSVSKDVITAQLDSINMATAGSLKPLARQLEAQVRAADPHQRAGGPAARAALRDDVRRVQPARWLPARPASSWWRRASPATPPARTPPARPPA